MMTQRIAVVTGARQGIGLETTKALLNSGHFVVMVDRQPFEGTVLVGSAHAANIMSHTLDVTDYGGVARLHQTINDLSIKIINYLGLVLMILKLIILELLPITLKKMWVNNHQLRNNINGFWEVEELHI
jgi:NAD(P)-dependent dehydrogenase (short-subunit alcohol dehydrogenase family)